MSILFENESVAAVNILLLYFTAAEGHSARPGQMLLVALAFSCIVSY